MSGLGENGRSPARLQSTLHEVVEKLAAIDRTPCSEGERQAAEWLAARMREGDGVRQESLLAAVTDLSSAGLVLERERRRIRNRSSS